MVSSFDGSKIIKEATLMTAAVDKIGGATKLTAAETKRYEATIVDAAAKMNALGQDVPEAWKKIAAETEKAAKATEGIGDGAKKSGASMSSLSGIATKLGPMLAATFSIGAVVNFAKGINDLAGETQDLSEKLGISTDAVQELAHAARDGGATIEDVGVAITKAQNAISENTKESAKSFKELGLSAASLQQLAPDEAFTKIAEAIKEIPDPMRQTKLAMDLFGESGAKMLPAIRSGMSDLRKEAHELGVVLDKDAIKGLDEFSKRWDNTLTAMKVNTANTVLAIADSLSTIDRLLDTAIAAGRLGMGPGGIGAAAALVGNAGRITDSRTHKTDIALPADVKSRPTAVVELTAEQKAIKSLADTLSGADIAGELKKLDAAWKSLTPTQKANEESIKRLVTAYADLRQKAKLDGLPGTLEAIHNAHLPVIKSTRDWADITGKLSTGPLVDLSRQTERVRNMLQALRADGLIPVTKSFADLSATNMIPWPVDGIKNAGEQITATKEKTVTLNDSLGGLARAWADLAQVRPLEGWVQDVAELIQLLNIGTEIGGKFRNTFTKQVTDSMGNVSTKFDFGALKGSEGTGNAIAAYANLAQTGVAGFGALDQATDVKGRGNRAAKGAMTGMAIGGAIVPGWGHLIGAGVGALVGALRNPGFEQEMKRISKNFGVDISEELARSIDQMRKQFGGDRGAAELFSLDKIIAEGGGLKDSNAGTMEKRLRDTFVMLETGKFTLEEGREVLDKNFATFAEHVRGTEGLASKTFQEIIALNKTFDTNSKAIKQFVDEQTGVLGVSVANLAAPLVGKNEDIKGRIADAQKAFTDAGRGGDTKEQEKTAERLNMLLAEQRQFAAGSTVEFERLGVIALGAFNAATAAGADWLTAVQNMSPALDTLIGLQRDLGIESQNAGLTELTRFRDLVTANQDLVLGTQALGDTMKALSTIGGINTETLAAMEAQGVQTFDRLRTAGFSEQQSLTMMKGHLLGVIEAHEQLGTPIDENTQKLIDMARKQGILKDDGKTMSDTLKTGFADMKLGTDRLVGSIGLMVRALGADVPAAVQDAINALDRIPRNIDVNARVIYDDPGAPGGPSSGDGGNSGPEHGAAGGIYATGAAGVATWFGEGGQPELGGPVNFMGDALSHAINRLGGGRSGGGGKTEIHIHLEANGREFAHAVVPYIPEVLALHGVAR